MSATTDRKAGAAVDPHDWPDEPERYDPAWDDLDARAHDPDPEQSGGWRNPPYEVRVVLVGAVWAAGTMCGLLVGVFVTDLCDPSVASAVGAVLFAFAGGWMEASG